MARFGGNGNNWAAATLGPTLSTHFMLSSPSESSVSQPRLRFAPVVFLVTCFMLWASVARAEDDKAAKDDKAKQSTADDATAKDGAPKEAKTSDKAVDATSGGTPGNPGQGDLDAATQLKVSA